MNDGLLDNQLKADVIQRLFQQPDDGGVQEFVGLLYRVGNDYEWLFENLIKFYHRCLSASIEADARANLESLVFTAQKESGKVVRLNQQIEKILTSLSPLFGS